MFKVKAPKGTRDLLPEDMYIFNIVINTLRDLFESYGYLEIKTPTFERFELFALRSGDEIRNSMFVFETGEGEMALRPELTAPVCRLIVEGKIDLKYKPVKVFYIGSCYRYEEPQAGRYREFWQAGCELLGVRTPEADAEILSIANEGLVKLGIRDYTLRIGDVAILRKILEKHKVEYEAINKILTDLDHMQTTISRLHNYLSKLEKGEDLNADEINDLENKCYRIELLKREIRYKIRDLEEYVGVNLSFNTKILLLRNLNKRDIANYVRETLKLIPALYATKWHVHGVRLGTTMVKIPKDATRTLFELISLKGIEHEKILDEAEDILKDYPEAINELQYFKEVLDYFKTLGANKFEVDLGLARGLEYYTGVIFEAHAKELGAQSQVCGGGRYDNLVREFGGPNCPAAGLAFGVDRLMILVKNMLKEKIKLKKTRIIVTALGDKLLKPMLQVVRILRAHGVPVEYNVSRESIRAILGYANAMGIPYVIIVAPREYSEGKVILRDMTKREQKLIPLDKLSKIIHELLG